MNDIYGIKRERKKKKKGKKERKKEKRRSMVNIDNKTYTLASSLPRSLTGVPVRGEVRLHSASSSGPSIFPGHHEPFLLLTQTIGPIPQSAAPDPELPIAPHTHCLMVNQGTRARRHALYFNFS